MRRIIPADHFLTYMIHHSSNIAQKRRLRKEHLTPNDWLRLLQEKAKNPLSIETVYDKIIFEQYNLHLLEKDLLERKGVKWSWGVENEKCN